MEIVVSANRIACEELKFLQGVGYSFDLIQRVTNINDKRTSECSNGTYCDFEGTHTTRMLEGQERCKMIGGVTFNATAEEYYPFGLIDINDFNALVDALNQILGAQGYDGVVTLEGTINNDGTHTYDITFSGVGATAIQLHLANCGEGAVIEPAQGTCCEYVPPVAYVGRPYPRRRDSAGYSTNLDLLLVGGAQPTASWRMTTSSWICVTSRSATAARLPDSSAGP